MDVEYGQYSVILLVEGFPPSHAGTITVYWCSYALRCDWFTWTHHHR
ncbi:hypothetical protein F9J31_19350 [Escherichia coli]|nr:hypothetical protein [Escherichia coli]